MLKERGLPLEGRLKNSEAEEPSASRLVYNHCCQKVALLLFDHEQMSGRELTVQSPAHEF